MVQERPSWVVVRLTGEVLADGPWPPARPNAGIIDRRLHHAGDSTAVHSPGVGA